MIVHVILWPHQHSTRRKKTGRHTRFKSIAKWLAVLVPVLVPLLAGIIERLL
jgi:hypothetical protein